MKAVFRNILFTTLFAAAVLMLTGCGNTVTSQKGPAYDDPAGSPAAGGQSGSTNKGFVYPKIASAVATAEIRGLDGSSFTINDKQGKVMLLNLWATWCGPCRAEIPALVRMQEKHGPQGFEVLGLNTDDEDVQLINNFSTELKINYPIAYADTQLQSSMLKISKFPGIPQSFLLDREGRLRGVFRGANPADIAKMEEVVAKVVSEAGDAPPAAVPPVLDERPAPADGPAEQPAGSDAKPEKQPAAKDAKPKEKS